MNLTDRLKRCFKPRFAVIYPFGVFVLFFCSSDESSLRNGIGYIIAGALLRLWSNGYAIKNDRLTTSGPYAFVRNPLYLGTLLIALGMAIVLKMGWAMTALFLAVLGWVYGKTIREEERMLEAKFKDEYKKYRSKIPVLVPSLIPYTQGEKWPFSIQRLIDSKEHKPVFWIIILLIVFHLKTRLLLEHKPMTATTWAWAAGLVLIGLDILYECNKKKIHAK